MISKRLSHVTCAIMATFALAGASSGQAEPGPYLARSNWPIFHADTRATAASPKVGPGDVRRAQIVRALTSRRVLPPSVSPWTVMAAPYSDGSQAVFTTPMDGVAKYLLDRNGLRPVAFLPLERSRLGFDWGIVLRADGTGVVTERQHNRFVIFGDASAGPLSPIRIVRRIPIDRERYGAIGAHFTLAPDGHLVALTDANRLIAVDLESGRVVANHRLENVGLAGHNSFPIDEAGRIFLAVQTAMIAVDWTGTRFVEAWRAPYDMRGPGCEQVPRDRPILREKIAVARGETCTGSGTTPTVLGDAQNGIVVIVDGHAPANNLVAFWRDGPPRGWTPLPDPTAPGRKLDARVAGVLALPHSTPLGAGFSAENSPAALGNAIVIAQWAGFSPKPDGPRGVQRVDWNPQERRLELRWANPDVHFNGVPTIACQQGRSCRTYGMGVGRDQYRYVSLDFETGKETGAIALGTSDDILDQGNSHAVANDGSIVYSGRRTMILVR